MEEQILLFVQNNIRNPILDPLMLFITHLGDAGIIWIIIIALLLLFKKTRRVGIYCTAALLLDLIFINGIIKNLVGRIRPYEVIDGLICMVGPQKDASFPSGHTASSVVTSTVIFMKMPKKAGIPAIVLAVLIALSRIYVGVHYPTDILGGLFFGILIALLTVYLMDRFFVRFDEMREKKKEKEEE